MANTKYKVITTSTGDTNAAIKVEKYVGGVLESTTNMPYGTYQQKWLDFDGFFRIQYNGSDGYRWCIEIITGIYEYSDGEVIKWRYSDSVNYTLTKKTIASYQSIEDIIAGVENAAQLVTSTKYDDNSYTISGIPDFVKYKGASVSSIYANGNSWIGLGESSEHFRFNRRDSAMYNLWKEEGTYLGKYRFFRIRWNGMSNYNSYGDPYKQTFDLILFDTGDVMLYAADIPTSYYNGTFYFADVAYTAPTTDSRYVTFYTNGVGTYTTVYAPIELAPAHVTKYLVRDGITIYTVTDGALVEVEGDISADLFQTKGTDDIPDGTLLMTLVSPEVLCWTDAEQAQKLTATVQGNPTGTHDIVSDNIPIGHSSIYGIASVESTASEGARFLLSFDGGLWMVYDTDSNTFVASDTGMTATELVAIPTDVWTSVVNSAENMRLKSVIEGVETVTQVKFNFNNESPI